MTQDETPKWAKWPDIAEMIEKAKNKKKKPVSPTKAVPTRGGDRLPVSTGAKSTRGPQNQ